MDPDRAPRRAWPSLPGGRRGLVLAAIAVLGLGGLATAAILLSRDDGAEDAPPTGQGGLVVQTGRDDDVKLDERRPLKCYVSGQFVGELTVADCAKRNGVPAGALGVGLDRNGALAGASPSSAEITPLPPDLASASAPIDELAAPPPQPSSAATPSGGTASKAAVAAAPTAACWLYAEGGWNRVGDDMALQACARALLDSRCDPAGPADLGRWGDHSLRLNGGRVEWMADESGYTPLSVRAVPCPPARG